MGERSHCTTRSPGSVRWQCGDLVGQRASKVLTHRIVHFYHQNGLIDLRMMEDRRIGTGSAAYSTPGSHGRLDQQQARPALRGLPKVEAAGEEAAVLPWCSPSSVVRRAPRQTRAAGGRAWCAREAAKKGDATNFCERRARESAGPSHM